MIPFLKWAGGKRWLVSTAPSLFPNTYDRYIEPFLGSGAVYFHLQPKRALLADSNALLIETYQAIKSDWRRVLYELRKHHRLHCKSYYYKIRSSTFRTPYTRAAKLIYLNRTCWNGLYRVNLKGEFNVPIGTKKDVVYETDNFGAVSKLLLNAKLLHSTFESIINEARKDDFVFVDPPYTVQHNQNNFIKYNDKLFHWDDQIRLRDCVRAATKRGAKVLVTNASNICIKELYQDVGELHELCRHSVISGKTKARGKFEEMIIKCY